MYADRLPNPKISLDKYVAIGYNEEMELRK